MKKKIIKSKVKKLKFSAIVEDLREDFSKLKDARKKPNYPIEDVVISVFAMMFFQDPSLLKFQERMLLKHNRTNLETIFGVKKIPCDNQIRNILDKVDSDVLQKISFKLLSHLQRSGKLKEFINLDKYYYVAIDGTQYFTSYKCHCNKCLTAQKKGQPIRYYHNVLQATLVDPEQKFVIPLMSEEIVNDNDEKSEEITSAKKLKQDSEHKAAERLLREVRKALPKLKIIILGDDLYSHEPMINLLKELDMSFILTAKSSSHKELSEFLKGEKSYIEKKTSRSTFNISKKIMLQRLKKIGKTKNDLKAPEVKKRYYKQVQVSEYRYYNGDAPINSKYKTFVNYFEIKTYDNLTKETLFYNSWVTDLDISKNNIKKLVKAGRARWNIENRQFLTTKKGGYNLEHNYGHGKENLSFNFYILNMLAFLVHQILHITSKDFNKFKEMEGSYLTMYEAIKWSLRYFIFETFDELILFNIEDNSS